LTESSVKATLALAQGIFPIEFAKEDLMQINKNRNRSQYTFANINLLGKCNANCFFCLGKDIKNELEGLNQMSTPFHDWINFEQFLTRCEDLGIKKLYMTGQTADGLQYKYLEELVDYLQNRGFLVGLRSNGLLAPKKMNIINKMKDEIAYSIHSLNDEINKKIGAPANLNWDSIIPMSGDNVRISIVPNRYNINEILDIIKFISKFKNVRYIQVRRISTDLRFEILKEDIELYEGLYAEINKEYPKVGEFYLSQEHIIHGMRCFFWRTVETNVNSLNYFTDGTCSDEYFVVEGYLKNRKVSYA